jgi:hypothetical protein
MAKGHNDEIDVLKLYAKGDTASWNEFLAVCDLNNDVPKLCDVLVRLQRGMEKVVKQNLNTEDISLWFIRITRSIEKTLKKIYRRQHKNPLWHAQNKHFYDAHISDKRELENNFEQFLMRTRY